uniref:Protein SERAC1 (inferred by orthology to a human protein) n=1 Tax=Anisakis simplex TaxID=6269 RepID=A0A0M3JWZ0_ANISI
LRNETIEQQRNAVHNFRLALKGSAVCAPILLISHREPRTPLQLEDAIKKLQLDGEWTKLMRWSVTHICDESDLACGDDMIGRRSGQEAKLNRLLTVLIAKCENGFGEELIEQGILSILFDLCTRFAACNRDLFISAMKLLANIVMQSEKCSMAVAESGTRDLIIEMLTLILEWLQRLAAMVSMNSLEENLLAEKVCLNAISVLTKSDVRFETDVYQLYRSDDVNQEPVVDLIFVHGLRGGVFRTWRAKDDPNDLLRTRCWPRSWLPYDLHKPIRILALDYPSSISNIRRGSVETLSERSSRFRKQLKAAGVGRRPIVFVGHSMGGLLVKRLMVDDEEMLRQTIGVMFIATPHRGSPLARYALRFAIRPTDDVLLLSLQNETNKKLHEDFLRICPSIAVICSMAETEDSPLILRQRGILVPSESAFFERGPLYHIRDVIYFQIHYNICKPSGPNDKAYGVILQFLHDVMYHLSRKC